MGKTYRDENVESNSKDKQTMTENKVHESKYIHVIQPSNPTFERRD